MQGVPLHCVDRCTRAFRRRLLRYQIDQILQDKNRRSLTRGWSRLLLYIPSQSTLETVSTTVIAATGVDETVGEEEEVLVAPISDDIATSVATLRHRAQLAERHAREHQTKLALHLVSQGDRKS